MKRKINTLLEEAKTKMSGYLALYSYNLMNLCIKAEPASLLSFEVDNGGELTPLENVAQSFRPDEYHFIIIPIEDKLLKNIGMAIAKSHPEFKQEVKQLDEDDSDENVTKYLYVTMPEVNDDRYKALTDAVDVLSQDCKNRLELTHQKYSVELSSRLITSPKEEQDEAKDSLNDLYDNICVVCDDYRDKKLKEIEEAHQQFVSHKTQEEEKKKNEEKAHGKSAGMSMRMFGEDD